MRAPAILPAMAAVAALGACAYQPIEYGPDLLARGAEPLYQLRPDGRIVATSCVAGRPSGYGSAPPGCAVDNAFAVQVAHPSDLVAPRQPGPPIGAPAAAAAYDYIYGDGDGLGGGDTVLRVEGTGAGQGGGAGRLDIPADGAAAGGEEPL